MWRFHHFFCHLFILQVMFQVAGGGHGSYIFCNYFIIFVLKIDFEFTNWMSTIHCYAEV